MSTVAGIDRARVSVLLDLRHPIAYLTLHPAIELGTSASIDLDWLPLATPALKRPTDPESGDDRGIRHRRYRAEAIAREIAVYSDVQGLTIREYYRSGSVDAANLGWLWVRARHPDRLSDYLVELFRLYWSLAIDASSINQIAALLDSLDADGDSFRNWSLEEGHSLAATLGDELSALGLFQAPAFLVEDEVFIGRQHLPMIEWIVDGRSGPIPI